MLVERHWGAGARETWKFAACCTQREWKVNKMIAREGFGARRKRAYAVTKSILET